MTDAKLCWALCPATRERAGGGHVARCCALASALAAEVPVVIVVQDGSERWRGWLAKVGIDSLTETEAERHSFEGVVIDDYELSAADVARWRERTRGPLAQIEDFGRPLAGIDLVINATPGLTGKKMNHIPALLGATYAMLGAPYAGRARPKIRKKIESVVVGIGLNDASGATECSLNGLAQAFDHRIHVDVFLGAQSPNARIVFDMIVRHDNWHLHLDCADPWRLAVNADLAISGGGQSLLERLALGIPVIGITVSENQQLALAGAAAAGAAIDLGFIANVSAERIAQAATMLENDFDKRVALSKAGQKLVDGCGAARVASHLTALSRSDRCHASA